MKGPGVSVVGDPPKRGSRRAPPADPDDDNGTNTEAYWRDRARQFLDAIAQTDEQIAQKKEEIRKFGSGGFDVTTGMKDNIAYINDRNAQLKQLETHKADLEKQFEELQDEGRKAGAPYSAAGIGSTKSSPFMDGYRWRLACWLGTISSGKKPGRRSRAGSPVNC